MDRINIIVPHFTGVTTAIVAFCFVCVIFPHLVKNKTQFYAGFAAVLLVILLHSLALMLYNSAGFQVFAGAATCLLQIMAIITLFLSAGGITLEQLGGDMSRAFEVIRRGEEGKTVIIPISDDMPNKREKPGVSPPRNDDEPAEHCIDLPEGAGWQRKPGSPPGDAGVPLE
ncbi:MAG TPA: hypothetical protein VGR35_15440 [Tepidisphaeraceae bacterium]|nr:hypothetical protein [Tepidisphaeraceae bacterium]